MKTKQIKKKRMSGTCINCISKVQAAINGKQVYICISRSYFNDFIVEDNFNFECFLFDGR